MLQETKFNIYIKEIDGHNNKKTKGTNGMQTDTINLLRECNAGIKMGEDAIKQVLPHAKNNDLRHTLEVCKNTHASLGDETHALLLAYGANTKDPHPIVSKMSSMKIYGTLMMRENDKTIANLMTDGCDMGIKSLSGYLNKYKKADDGAKNIAKRLIASEEYLENKLRDFL